MFHGTQIKYYKNFINRIHFIKMTEAQVGFLYNIAAALPESQNNALLKSFYLMRCKEVTRGYGLPDKHFSSLKRCPNCCIEWKKDTETKVRPIKLSKRQKQRLKSKNITNSKKEYVRRRKDLSISNEVVQTCSFCKNNCITTVLKPQKLSLNTEKEKEIEKTITEDTIINNKQKKYQKMRHEAKKAEINFYANALDVFSMKNKNNTLASTVKEKPKIIKNNKKKKDKFAGLCQMAVLASAKLKETNKKQNSLNLFLKPST